MDLKMGFRSMANSRSWLKNGWIKMSFIAVGSMWVDIWNSNLSLLMATLGNMRYVEKQNIINRFITIVFLC